MTTTTDMTAESWDLEKQRRKKLLIELLGFLPESLRAPRPKVKSRTIEVRENDGYALEQLSLETEPGTQIPALFARPRVSSKPAPTVVYLHCHGHQYDQGKVEIVQGKVCKRISVYGVTQVQEGVGMTSHLYATHEPYLKVEPCAPDLVARGYNVLALDSVCFGERQENEEALFWELISNGKTILGKMIWDEMRGIDYLCGRPDVDAGRIGCMGMSMGGMKTWWLAALDERIAVAVAICYLTTYRAVLAHRVQNMHRPNLWVPALLRYMDAGEIVSLIAPRPFLSINGTQDVSVPLDGLNEVHDVAGKVYSFYGSREKLQKELHDTDHQFTAIMRQQAYTWLDRWL